MLRPEMCDVRQRRRQDLRRAGAKKGKVCRPGAGFRGKAKNQK